MSKPLKILIITAFFILVLNLFVTLFLLWNFRSLVNDSLDSYSLRSVRKPLPLK